MVTKKRPPVLEGKTIKVKTGCGNMYLTINSQDGELLEVRAQIGKCGCCVRLLLEQVSNLYSKLLQVGAPKEDMITFFEKNTWKVSCGNSFMFEEKEYTSCLDYIAQTVFKEFKHDPEQKKHITGNRG